MKRITILLMALLFAGQAWSVEYESTGIRYEITNRAAVIAKSTPYSGSVSIPSKVFYEGQSYDVEFISTGAFSGCYNLTYVSIPSTVLAIGDYAFAACENLKSISIPEKVTLIGTHAFRYCNSLTSVTIPNSVVYIGYGAFEGCGQLKSITISKSASYIGEAAFSMCGSLTSLRFDGGTPNSNGAYVIDNDVLFNNGKTLLLCYLKSGTGWYTIPSSVTRIGNYAFAGRQISSVTIPNSVKTIGREAFLYCANLGSVNMGDRITTIEDYAFSNCSDLKSIDIPATVTSIGYGAFKACTSLNRFDVDEGNSYYASDMTGVLFNKLKTVLMQYPLNGSTSYSIPSSVKKIEDYAFSQCPKIKSITIYNNGVDTIGFEAFSYSSLNSISFGNDVKIIRNRAFIGCNNLESITIPNNVTSIGGDAFSYCQNLTTIKVQPSNSYYMAIDNVLFNREKKNLIVCGKRGGEYIIPNGVATIESGAFSYCSDLTSVVMPISLTSIEDDAFSGCYNLSDIHILHKYGTNYPICNGYYVFSGVNKETCTLHVLEGWKSKFQQANGWKEFLNVKEYPLNIQITVNATPPNTGITDGAGTYFYRDSVKLHAITTEDYSFDCWMKNQQIVSYSKDYSFMAIKDDTLTAHFSKNLFINGEGTKENPWLIATSEELSDIRHYNGIMHTGKHFQLINDIDLTNFLKDSTNGWLPIGGTTEETAFYGKIDGNGYRITNFWMNQEKDTIGLFSYLGKESKISNLGICIAQNKNIRGTASYVGALVGFNLGTIENCHVVGKITCLGSCIGGLIGKNADYLHNDITTAVLAGKITNCYAMVDIISIMYLNNTLGGLVGYNYGPIENCFSTGNIIGGDMTGNIGGIAGYSGWDIKNCYTTGNIVGATGLGGIVGVNWGNIHNNYTTGAIKGIHALNRGNVGGIVGSNENYQSSANIQNCAAVNLSINAPMNVNRIAGKKGSGPLSNNFALDSLLVNNTIIEPTSTDPADSVFGMNKSLSELQTQVTYQNGLAWDFVNNWSIWENNSFPYFKWQSSPAKITEINKQILKGELQQTAQKIEVYKNHVLIGSTTNINNTSWECPIIANLNDTLQVMVYELGKAPSYPVTAIINEQDIPVTGITLSGHSISLKVNQDSILTYILTPEDATNKNVIWNSHNESIATVNNGIVTAKIEGSTYIVATTEDGGFKDSCSVTITANGVPVTGIALNTHNLAMKVDSVNTLIATIIPENATNKNISWGSSDTNIATVNNGTVTAKTVGSAYIIATTENGSHKDSCLIIVTTLGIENTENVNTNFVVYPNPTHSGKLTIALRQKAQGAGQKETAIQLYDLVGKLIGHFAITGEKTEIDISYLPSGTYFVKVGDAVRKVTKR